MSYFEYCPDPFEDDPEDLIVECKHCGKGGLHWESDNEKWILTAPNGLVHRCTPKADHLFKGIEK